jgi:hypothetical protein
MLKYSYLINLFLKNNNFLREILIILFYLIKTKPIIYQYQANIIPKEKKNLVNITIYSINIFLFSFEFTIKNVT